MATKKTGRDSSDMDATDWSATTGEQTGDPSRDRRAADDTKGSGIAQTLRDSTYRRIDDQKSRASDTLGSLAGAVRGMSQPLRDGGQPQVADYVNKAADGIERWASQLRQQDLEDGVRAVEQFARQQPAMFLGLAFGAGVLASRFLKSSRVSGETRTYAGRFDTAVGAGPTSIGSTGFGSAGYGSTGLRSADTTVTGRRGASSSGDIPRISSDLPPAGEVL